MIVIVIVIVRFELCLHTCLYTCLYTARARRHRRHRRHHPTQVMTSHRPRRNRRSQRTDVTHILVIDIPFWSSTYHFGHQHTILVIDIPFWSSTYHFGRYCATARVIDGPLPEDERFSKSYYLILKCSKARVKTKSKRLLEYPNFSYQRIVLGHLLSSTKMPRNQKENDWSDIRHFSQRHIYLSN